MTMRSQSLPGQQQSMQMVCRDYRLRGTPKYVEGVPFIESQGSDCEEVFPSIAEIQQKLRDFKLRKARQVVQQHKQFNQPIQTIISRIKDDLRTEALRILHPLLDPPTNANQKQMLSTVAGTVKRSNGNTAATSKNTSSMGKKELTIDLTEFTLGQKESSPYGYPEEEVPIPEVKEFRVQSSGVITRRIKEKLMRPKK